MIPSEELKKRALPPLPDNREEIKELLQREVYGRLPDYDYSWSVNVTRPGVRKRLDCGNVTVSVAEMTINVNGVSHTFPLERILHNDDKKRPLVVLMNFHDIIGSNFFPLEEMSEYDVDFLAFVYKDVTSDDDDFTTGLAPALLAPGGREDPEACGKIAMWAWTAMRVLDYGLTLPGTDPANVAVAGHSRLGKTALYTAMMDERFRFCFSNAAGCSGDSLGRGNTGHGRTPKSRDRGELIDDITRRFPFWFCANYKKYAEKNFPDDFDQHFLAASIAPRCVMIGSCDLDLWADPISQQLCAMAAGEAWEKLGLAGYVGEDRFLEAGEGCPDGNVGYFKIHSLHMFSRHSWKWYMTFLEKHKAVPDAD